MRTKIKIKATSTRRKSSWNPSSLSIVKFAHKIGKPTSEFTQLDMINFLDWLLSGKVPAAKPIVCSTIVKNGRVLITWNRK